MNKTTLTVAEVADMIRVSQDCIYKMVREKQIPFFRVRSRIMFRAESIDAWMQEMEQVN